MLSGTYVSRYASINSLYSLWLLYGIFMEYLFNVLLLVPVTGFITIILNYQIEASTHRSKKEKLYCRKAVCYTVV